MADGGIAADHGGKAAGTVNGPSCVTCTMLPSLHAGRAPTRMLFTSPRSTAPGQIDTSSPSSTSPITLAPVDRHARPAPARLQKGTQRAHGILQADDDAMQFSRLSGCGDDGGHGVHSQPRFGKAQRRPVADDEMIQHPHPDQRQRSRRRSVMVRSAALASVTPLGWLCANITAAALCASALDHFARMHFGHPGCRGTTPPS